MALINNNRKAIFVHIYKTGGTSIRKLLSGFECCDLHCPAWHVRAYLDSTEDSRIWNEYFKFAVVRNPYDFVVSLYHHIHNSTEHAWHNAATGTIDQFVLSLMTNHFNNSLFHGYQFFQTQWQCVSEFDEVILDKVYRFEELHKAFKDLSYRVGTEDVVLHLNKTPTRKSRDFIAELSGESIEIINELYAEDFLHFQYSKIHKIIQ